MRIPGRWNESLRIPLAADRCGPRDNRRTLSLLVLLLFRLEALDGAEYSLRRVAMITFPAILKPGRPR
jgi:hypothetical protein